MENENKYILMAFVFLILSIVIGISNLYYPSIAPKGMMGLITALIVYSNWVIFETRREKK